MSSSLVASVKQAAESDGTPAPLSLEQRIFLIEQKIEQFERAAAGIGKFFYDDPKGKMFIMMLPKSMQQKIAETFGGNRQG